MFGRLVTWQKGALSGFLFAVIVGLLYTVVLVIIDLVLYNKGLALTCFMIGSGSCGIGQAIISRLIFLVVFLAVFGIPLAAVGGFIGFAVDRFSLK